jgi:predicted SprT family Zn-dependent metalloprotease
MEKCGVMGATYFKSARIEIGKRSKTTGVAYRSEEINETFWHELTHAILNDMGSSLDRDEEFVIAFSKRLAQAVSTAKL